MAKQLGAQKGSNQTWANRGTDSRFELKLELIIFTPVAKTSRVNVEMIRLDYSRVESARGVITGVKTQMIIQICFQNSSFY